MIAPRKYVHLLLMISELILIGCALLMIIKYDRTEWNHKIWMGSKIFTLNQTMKSNNNGTYPIMTIYPNGTQEYYHENYESLLKHSGKQCDDIYKSCGILDTLGNLMCIPKDEPCPINEIKITLSSDLNLTLDSTIEYKKGFMKNLKDDLVLLYTNETIEQNIVVKLNYTIDDPPKYIFKDNFIFDYDTYQDSITTYSSGDGYDSDWDWDSGGWDSGDWGGGDWDSGGGIDSGGGGFRKLEEEEEIYGSTEVNTYILDRFEDDINIDKSFTKLKSHIYAGNYIGFQDYSNLEKYSNLALYDIYFTVFPNKTAYAFCYFLIIIFIGLIIFSMTRFCHKDVPNEGFNPSAVLCGKLEIIIPYLIFYIGYFVYIVYEYVNIYQRLKPFDLRDIKADPFIEEFLEDIESRHFSEITVIIIITLYSASMCTFLLAWILSQIFTKRYLDLLNKTKNCNTQTEMFLKN